MSVSAVVLTLNEEDNIKQCLESLQWCDEIIVVDSYSEDKTVRFAEQKGAKVIKKENKEGKFDSLRNLGIKEAKNNWIFVLDADEICSYSLSQRLLEIKDSGRFDAVKIPRKNYVYGGWKKYDWWPDYQLRFFDKNVVEFSQELHDFTEVDDEARIEKLDPELDYAIEHFSFTGVEDRISRVNKYTTIEAMSEDPFEGKLAILRAFKEFIKVYFVKKGFLNGYEGFIEAWIDSSYIMIEDFKKWQIARRGKVDEIEQSYKERKDEVLSQFGDVK